MDLNPVLLHLKKIEIHNLKLHLNDLKTHTLEKVGLFGYQFKNNAELRMHAYNHIQKKVLEKIYISSKITINII